LQAPLAAFFGLSLSSTVPWQSLPREKRESDEQNQAISELRLAEVHVAQDSAFDTPMKHADFPQNFPQLWKTGNVRS
jgi:hypothetical protein